MRLFLRIFLFAFVTNLSQRIYISFALPVDGVIEAAAMTKRELTSSIEVPPPEILRFMRRFGYLQSNPSDSEALYHESAIVEAVKNIQKYGALNQTGKLDNETLDLFSKPRCGVPDMEGMPYYLATNTQNTTPTTKKSKNIRNRRFVIGARTWKKRNLRYYIANSSLKIPQQQVERDISGALSLWASYSGLRFIRVNNTAADIIVGFGSRYHGDNYPFDGPGNILAHAYYPYEMGSWGGDIHFDEDENWKENTSNLTDGVDFYSVAVHELGHSLGLAHSPIHTSIMFPYYKGAGHNVLDYDDISAMYDMYLNKKLEGDESDDLLPSTTTVNVIYSTEDQTMNTTESTKQKNETFQDDYATIAQHKNRCSFILPTTTALPNNITPSSTCIPSASLWSKPECSQIPNICKGNFDAFATINGSVYIFKQEYVWKLTRHFTTMNGYPSSIYEIFPFLPKEVSRIDAAYERYDGAGVFFTGQTLWVFNGSQAIENSPRPLTNLLGSKVIVSNVDAAMMWPKNNYTYIFAGGKFWRYDDRLKVLHAGYPKSMARWPGIPSNIDAAGTLRNGKTYFFKNNLYWLYNNMYVRPERGYPRRASAAWLSCLAPTKTALRNFNTTVSFISSLALTSTWIST